VWAEEERFAQPFTYAGQAGVLRERAHGLYHMRARYYQVASQRFISEDPSGFNGGLNLYAYVGGNPLGFVDPSGLERVPVFASPVFGGNARHLYIASSPVPDPDRPNTVRFLSTWGRGGSSGVRSESGTGGFTNPAGRGERSPHQQVGEVFIPGATDAFRLYNELNANGHNGLYLPFVNDCHTSIFRAAAAIGAEWRPGANYQGRLADDLPAGGIRLHPWTMFRGGM